MKLLINVGSLDWSWCYKVSQILKVEYSHTMRGRTSPPPTSVPHNMIEIKEFIKRKLLVFEWSVLK